MKRLPKALVVGLVIQLVFDSARVIHHLTMSPADDWARWEVYEAGFNFATAGLLSLGLWELAGGLRDRRAIGARVAAIAQFVQLAIALVWIGIELSHSSSKMLAHIVVATQYLQSLVVLATSIGLALAMRTAVLGIITGIVAFVGVPLPALGELYQPYEIQSKLVAMLVYTGPYVALSALWVALAWVGSADVELPAVPQSANAAFATAAKAMWLRLIAAVSIGGITFLVAVSRGPELAGLFKGVTLLAPIVDAIALAMFAVAAVRLSRAQIAPWLTAIGAACAMWTVGVITSWIPTLYTMLYADAGYRNQDSAAAMHATVVPLVGGAAITLVLMAVAKLARERGFDEVRENVAVRTGVFVALTLGVLFVINYGLKRIDSEGEAIFALLALVCASFYSLVLAAKICTQGAELVERDPRGLPAATLVKSGDA